MRGMPDNYWAKFKQTDQGPSWLPLIYHMVDVAVMFRKLLDTGHDAALAAWAGVPVLSEIQKQRLCVLAFLHDVGKAVTDFQGQVFPDFGPRRHHGHTDVACSLFQDRLYDVLMVLLPDNYHAWFARGNEDTTAAFARMLLATLGHHGRPVEYAFEDADIHDERLKNVRWDGWRYADLPRLADEIRNVIQTRWPRAAEPDEPIVLSSDFMYEYNGLLTLADWMASDDRHFEYEPCSDVFERAEYAEQRADALMRSVGYHADPQTVEFGAVFGFTPNPMQSAMLEVTARMYQ